ncbi:MAG: hypothetical protein QM680_02985 [Luteolibacter sp.]
MQESPLNFELAEPASPEGLLPRFSLEFWMLPAALALVFALIAIFLIIRRIRQKRSAISAPRQSAFHEAATALAALQSDSTRQTAVLASLILRKYLSVAASDPALFETHDEFITRHDSLASLDETTRAEATHGFARLAALKYSPDESSGNSPESIVADSLQLLETLHHGLSA